MNPILYYILGSLFILLTLSLVLFKKKSTKHGLLTHQHKLSLGLSNLFAQNDLTKILVDLEELLIAADVGVHTTGLILQELGAAIKSEKLKSSDELKSKLKSLLEKIIIPVTIDFNEQPSVCLMVGVNGVGKTTSIGKLAYALKQEGKNVLMVAADTFRAGAIAQLKVWAERAGVPIIAQQEGADPAAVAFDGVSAGLARGMDVVLVDTAGRLQSKSNLMEELKKIKRVITKAMPTAPHHVWLTIDATAGQNALGQAREFNEALGLTGIILSKWDSTGKGGMILAIANELKLPVVYVGIGEKVEDLQLFDTSSYIDALLNS